MDLLMLGIVALRCARYYLYGSNRRDGHDEDQGLLSDMPRLSYRKSALTAAILTGKFLFEVLCCLQLKWRLLSNLLYVFLPLWVSLSLVIMELARQIVEIHKKAI